jgi:hypothetical protein
MGGVQGNLQTVRYTWECGTASTHVVDSKISLIAVGTVWYTILFTELVCTAKPGICAWSALFSHSTNNKQTLYSETQSSVSQYLKDVTTCYMSRNVHIWKLASSSDGTKRFLFGANEKNGLGISHFLRNDAITTFVLSGSRLIQRRYIILHKLQCASSQSHVTTDGRTWCRSFLRLITTFWSVHWVLLPYSAYEQRQTWTTCYKLAP